MFHFWFTKRKFHVSYQWVAEKQAGFGSITITAKGRLTSDAIQGMKEYIDELHPEQQNVIIAVTELEC